MSHVWPEVPHDRPAYAALSTDFWPWSEVFADLSARTPWSGALELRQGEHFARAVWAEGVALGGHMGGSDHDLHQLALALPRAEVSLYVLDAHVARLAWQCRAAEVQYAASEWLKVRADLTFRAFTGVVRAAAGDSYWQSGVRVSGPEPTAGDRVTLLTPALGAVTNESVIEFYNVALAVAARTVDVEAHWRASVLELAEDHLCLDPFAREVVYEQGRLVLALDVPADELLPALRAAYSLTLRRAGKAVAELPLDALRVHPLWALSGLGEA